MHKLRCSFQPYAWGKLGKDSEVAKLVNNGGHAASVDNEKPYAEMWMGVHPNGPSHRQTNGVPLADFVAKSPSVLGAHENGTLQFLFKVLSVRTALSVQSHPTKEEAKALHASDPKNYPDDNHKPEMAIALTDFQLLCGFRPAEEIIKNLKDCPELLELLGDTVSSIDGLSSASEEERKAALRSIFSNIWKQSAESLKKAIDVLIQRLKGKGDITDLERLILRLDWEFPGGDVGVFAPLFLNYFTLKPGESVFLGPNIPHAYLFGDCVECMACSDNTIRAGLTPKFKDVATLCANLNYTMQQPPYFTPSKTSDGVLLYNPPVPEFAVEQVTAAATTLTNIDASSLFLVVEGEGKLRSGEESCDIRRGDVIFLSANLKDISLEASSNLIAFRAYTPK